jgi:hypothetical protein
VIACDGLKGRFVASNACPEGRVVVSDAGLEAPVVVSRACLRGRIVESGAGLVCRGEHEYAGRCCSGCTEAAATVRDWDPSSRKKRAFLDFWVLGGDLAPLQMRIGLRSRQRSRQMRIDLVLVLEKERKWEIFFFRNIVVLWITSGP